MTQANLCFEIIIIASYSFAHKFQLYPDLRNFSIPVDGSSVSLLQSAFEKKPKENKLIDREIGQKIIEL